MLIFKIPRSKSSGEPCPSRNKSLTGTGKCMFVHMQTSALANVAWRPMSQDHELQTQRRIAEVSEAHNNLMCILLVQACCEQCMEDSPSTDLKAWSGSFDNQFTLELRFSPHSSFLHTTMVFLWTRLSCFRLGSISNLTFPFLLHLNSQVPAPALTLVTLNSML